MSNVIALRQPPSVALSTEGLRAVMIRRGRIIRALRARLYQLANTNVRLDQDLDEANAYIADLENRLDDARDDAARWRSQAEGATC
jgi:hypothetical protein